MLDNDAHRLIVPLVPDGARVLDLGCGDGTLARTLAGRGCRVVGVEQETDAAGEACEKFLRADLDELKWPNRVGRDFDVVLFADVLEHLRRPDAVLGAARGLLAGSGCVVASVPNVAHASIRLALLMGHFAYTQKGLLDATHVRLFTAETIEALFRTAGLAPATADRVTAGPFDTEIRLDAAWFPKTLVDWILKLPEATTYQFIIRATPAGAPSSAAAPPPETTPPPETVEAWLKARGDVGDLPLRAHLPASLRRWAVDILSRRRKQS